MRDAKPIYHSIAPLFLEMYGKQSDTQAIVCYIW